jgi:hypothetical protein
MMMATNDDDAETGGRGDSENLFSLIDLRLLDLFCFDFVCLFVIKYLPRPNFSVSPRRRVAASSFPLAQRKPDLTVKRVEVLRLDCVVARSRDTTEQ